MLNDNFKIQNLNNDEFNANKFKMFSQVETGELLV